MIASAVVALGVVFLQRLSEREARRDTNRGATYVDAVAVMEAFHLNMMQWMATPTFETVVAEPTDQELRHLYGRVRVYASERFNDAWNEATGVHNAFMARHMVAAIAHASDDADPNVLLRQRLELADLETEMKSARDKLERIARSELG